MCVPPVYCSMDEDAPDLCEDLRNVREGDAVTLTTTEDEFYAECTKRESWHDPDPDVVKEETVLEFDQEGAECTLRITDGLRRFEWEAPYPRHTPVFDETNEVTLGYVTGVKIHGKMEA